jgi:hypothetical protein
VRQKLFFLTTGGDRINGANNKRYGGSSLPRQSSIYLPVCFSTTRARAYTYTHTHSVSRSLLARTDIAGMHMCAEAHELAAGNPLIVGTGKRRFHRIYPVSLSLSLSLSLSPFLCRFSLFFVKRIFPCPTGNVIFFGRPITIFLTNYVRKGRKWVALSVFPFFACLFVFCILDSAPLLSVCLSGQIVGLLKL